MVVFPEFDVLFEKKSTVIAGLDPAIHRLRKSLAKGMDARVKPGHDEFSVGRRPCV
jgi:hypothetical protein